MHHIFKKNYNLDIKHFVPMRLVQFNRTWEVNFPEILPTTMNTDWSAIRDGVSINRFDYKRNDTCFLKVRKNTCLHEIIL